MEYAYPVKFKVRSQLDNTDIEVDPNPDLRIHGDLTEAMKKQPALFAYYGALAEEEYRRGKRIKYRLHCLSEELDEKYRKEQTKRITERELNNKIKRHPQMRALYDRYIATMRRAGHLKVIKDTLEQKFHLLQSMGAMHRKELDTELRTLQRKMKKKLTNTNEEKHHE